MSGNGAFRKAVHDAIEAIDQKNKATERGVEVELRSHKRFRPNLVALIGLAKKRYKLAVRVEQHHDRSVHQWMDRMSIDGNEVPIQRLRDSLFLQDVQVPVLKGTFDDSLLQTSPVSYVVNERGMAAKLSDYAGSLFPKTQNGLLVDAANTLAPAPEQRRAAFGG